jgi:hypothetical protein
MRRHAPQGVSPRETPDRGRRGQPEGQLGPKGSGLRDGKQPKQEGWKRSGKSPGAIRNPGSVQSSIDLRQDRGHSLFGSSGER